MLKSVEGIHHNGRVEIAEVPEDIEETRVIVTFLPTAPAKQLSDYGIDTTQAADLRARLRTFEEDWNRPDMDSYDALQLGPCVEEPCRKRHGYWAQTPTSAASRD